MRPLRHRLPEFLANGPSASASAERIAIAARPGSSHLSLVVAALAASICFCALRANAMPEAIPASAEQGNLCKSAIRQAEVGSNLPPHLLAGIAHVESGRHDAATGQVQPWPWTINAEGKGSFFDTKAEAIAYVRQLQAQGIRSIDTGCMQVNLMHHPTAFRDLEEAFDPLANARYAVTFLTELRDKTGSWETASAWYHSANPIYGNPYRQLVMAAMAEDARAPSASDPLPILGSTSNLIAAPWLRNMPLGLAKYTIPPRSNGIAVQPQLAIGPGKTGLDSAAASTVGPQIAPASMSGRGLDAYRQHPVAMVAPRVIATR